MISGRKEQARGLSLIVDDIYAGLLNFKHFSAVCFTIKTVSTQDRPVLKPCCRSDILIIYFRFSCIMFVILRKLLNRHDWMDKNIETDRIDVKINIILWGEKYFTLAF